MSEAVAQLAIVALGARLPVGLSPETAAAAIRAGISRITEHPYLLDGAGEPLHCGRDRFLPQAAYGSARSAALAGEALAQVLASVPRNPNRNVALLLAVPEERPGFESAAARELMGQLSHRAEREDLLPELCGRGHAGAFAGLARAAVLLAQSKCDFCIVGGVDSYLHADTLNWLDGQRRLHRTDVRTGFLPGEGSVMVGVTLPSTRRRLGLPALGLVRTVANATERRSLDSDEGSLGEGLSNAVYQATASLAPDEQITDIYADINGERHRSEEWGFTLLRHPQHFRNGSQYISAAEQCGDVGAATGALQVMLAVRAFQRHYARGNRALVFAGSWQGARGVALLEAMGA
jgi:3-oxoacyl-[acyl-carrier-protein] synthase-1